MDNVPQDTRVPIAQVAARFQVSEAALQFAIRAGRPGRMGGNVTQLRESAITALHEPRFTQAQIARWLNVSSRVVRTTLNASPSTSLNRFSQADVAYVWQATSHIHSIPVITSDRVFLRHVADVVGYRTTQLNNVIHRYSLNVGPTELRRRSVDATQGMPTISLKGYEVIQAWFSNYPPHGWYPLYVLIAASGLRTDVITTYLVTTKAEVRVYRDALHGRWLSHYPESAINELVDSAQQSDGWISITEIALRLRRSVDWVIHRIDRNLSQYRIAENGLLAICYPPQEVARLKSLNQVPPAGDWLTDRNIAALVPNGVQWVQVRLNQQLGELRVNDRGVSVMHYPPSEAARLQQLSNNLVPAEDWLTVKAMRALLGRDGKWITARINTGLAQERVTPLGSVRLHYPPEEFLRLKQLSAQQAPAAAGWLTAAQIAKALGHDKKWVLARINQELAQTRTGSSNREEVHFPPSELVRLKQSSDAEVPAGNWLTVQGVAAVLSRSERWVKQNIRTVEAQDRLSASGRVLPHYSPAEVSRLQAMPRRSST